MRRSGEWPCNTIGDFATELYRLFPASCHGAAAAAVSASIGTASSARSCVAPRTTGGATPASVRFQPPGRAHTPAVALVQAREPPFGARRREIVPRLQAEREELLRHHRTHGVAADVLWPRGAAPVAEEPRHRVLRAGQQVAADDVAVRIAIHASTVPVRSPLPGVSRLPPWNQMPSRSACWAA